MRGFVSTLVLHAYESAARRSAGVRLEYTQMTAISDAREETEQSCKLCICICLDQDPDGFEHYPLDEVDKPMLEINGDTKEGDKSQNKAHSIITSTLSAVIQYCSAV
jgi:hypothetical protein